MLLDVFLPLSLAFIMFSLGIGLTIADFVRVGRVFHAFLAGTVAQMVLLPVVAFILLMIFPVPQELAVGVMILSFCPGGVTSNILTKIAGGTVALSVTLTAIVSLIAVVTVPVLVGWSADHFMGLAAPQINVTELGLSMFAITAVPVGLGVAVRHFASGFAIRSERIISAIAIILFVVIVIGALASNWTIFVENVGVLGPILVALNVAMLLLGFFMARMMGLVKGDAITVAIEAGVQNATLGIAIGSLIAEAASGLPPFSLPSGVYGITMYFVTAPFILWMRRG